MPALFIGHGNPMNGIEDNEFVRSWLALGDRLPRPRAILSVSAHWLTEGTYVHRSAKPQTIHDFWGFPEELYQVSYPSPGSPELAGDIISLLGETTVEPDNDWGLDHGTWVPLLRLFPAADIPVLQLSVDLTRPAAYHYDLGRRLAPLRDEGVLIMGSGNIVHNLGRARFDRESAPYDWAQRFDELSRELIEAGDHEALVAYEKLGRDAALSIPTPDHFWPLMYVLGLQAEGDAVSFPVNGLAHASVSMRAVAFGL